MRLVAQTRLFHQLFHMHHSLLTPTSYNGAFFFFLYFPALQNPEALKHKKEREDKLTARVHRSSTNRQGDIELAVFFSCSSTSLPFYRFFSTSCLLVALPFV